MSDLSTWGYARGLVRALRTELLAFEDQTQRTEKDLLQMLIATKRRQFELSTLVMAVVETLAAHNQLDLDVLDGRLENLRADQGFSLENPEPLSADRPYQCTSCYRAMTITEGTMVAGGMHCPTCLAGRT